MCSHQVHPGKGTTAEGVLSIRTYKQEEGSIWVRLFQRRTTVQMSWLCVYYLQRKINLVSLGLTLDLGNGWEKTSFYSTFTPLWLFGERKAVNEKAYHFKNEPRDPRDVHNTSQVGKSLSSVSWLLVKWHNLYHRTRTFLPSAQGKQSIIVLYTPNHEPERLNALIIKQCLPWTQSEGLFTWGHESSLKNTPLLFVVL